jgi:hypothetical protein
VNGSAKRKLTEAKTAIRDKPVVFMSFATPDAGLANDLRTQIEGTGQFNVTPFERSQQWHSGTWNVAEIHRLIGDADAFLLIFTRNSLSQEWDSWLRYEYSFAVFRANNAQAKPCTLVRAVFEDLTSEEQGLPAELISFQTIDYRDPHSHEACLDILVMALLGPQSVPSLTQRQKYVFKEALQPNPRREMYARVLRTEFDAAFRSNIGRLEDELRKLSNLQRAQDNLMTPEFIHVEEAKAFDDIWVVTHTLQNDLYEEKISSSIATNLEKGIRYTYFVPDTQLIRRRLPKFEQTYGRYRKSNGTESAQKEGTGGQTGSFEFIFLEAGVFMPFDELVVYDGESAIVRWGYIQMSYDRVGDTNDSGLLMKIPDRTLNTIVTFLRERRLVHQEREAQSGSK